MTPLEMETLCLAAMDRCQDAVTLTLPSSFKRPPGFPRGSLLSVNAAGEKNFTFDPWRLLLWVGPALLITDRIADVSRTPQ